MERARSSKLRLRMTGIVKERLSNMRTITTHGTSMERAVHHRHRRVIGTSGTENHLDRHLINDSKTRKKPSQREKDVTLEGAAILVRQGAVLRHTENTIASHQGVNGIVSASRLRNTTAMAVWRHIS